MAQELKTTERRVPSKLDGGEPTRSRPVFVPRTDIYETEDNVVVLVDMPGVASEGVDITLEKRTLAIRGYATDQQHDNYRQIYAEYGAGNYERVFTLSEDIDQYRGIAEERRPAAGPPEGGAGQGEKDPVEDGVARPEKGG